MSRPRILLVEDEESIAVPFEDALVREGFDPVLATTGADALRLAREESPDLVLLDLGLPDTDGRDVVQALRAQGAAMPIIFLTAKDALTDRVTGFSAGGDDYLTKPFAFAELVARLQALLRRAPTDTVVAAGSLRLDPLAHVASAEGHKVPLTPTEFRLLAKLVANQGATVRRRDLVRTGWPHGARVRDNTLDAYVARLRRKLGELPGTPTITTVHGVGYLLE